MRIVHLVGSGDVAGGQLVALHLARAARAAGHEAAFVSPSDGPFLDAAAGEGFETACLRLGGALDVPSTLRLRRLLRSLGADLLHTHTHFSLNVLGRVAARLAGVPVVAHMHIENVFRPGLGGRAQRSLDNATARLCASILAVSQATRESVVGQGYPAGRIVVVPNGIDAPPAEPRRPDGIGPETPLVLHVGRLAAVKGQRELIAALGGLRHENAVAVLVGEDLEAGGRFRDGLDRQAADAGLAGRVVFAGRRDDVPGLMAGADVFALPSHAEGLPLVVLEAMAQGLPVVATPVGGTPEAVVDGETGRLVPPGDVAALAAALDELLDNADLRRRLGEAGRTRVRERFSLEAQARAALEVYASIVSGGSM